MKTPNESSVAETPAQGQMQGVAAVAGGFGWYHRREPGRPDHVISLCGGHKYLTEKGRWQSGPGDMPTLPPPSGCCVCNGFGTVARMKNAPLKPNTDYPAPSCISKCGSSDGKDTNTK